MPRVGTPTQGEARGILAPPRHSASLVASATAPRPPLPVARCMFSVPRAEMKEMSRLRMGLRGQRVLEDEISFIRPESEQVEPEQQPEQQRDQQWQYLPGAQELRSAGSR